MAAGRRARRMVAAVMPYASEYFITPMAAVAGAVAEEILATMVSAADVSRAYVNDGGDIALHLTAAEKFVVGMIERPDRPSLLGTTTVHSADPVRGIATSGWRGRSFSLGIADAVTVLAERAAVADAAATMIANAVDLPGHRAIVRIPACELAPDSDLGERLVTQAVGELSTEEVNQALASGARTAERLLRVGLIRSAALSLQGETRLVGALSESRMIATPITRKGPRACLRWSSEKKSPAWKKSFTKAGRSRRSRCGARPRSQSFEIHLRDRMLQTSRDSWMT